MWKRGTAEFSFCGKPESEKIFFFFSSENSRFVENGNWRILVLWKTKIGEFLFFFYPRIVVLLKRRILVLWKTGTGRFSFCGETESENFFFFLSENSCFVENGNWRILVLWKIRIGEFFFFLSENSRFVENGNLRILVLWKTRIGESFFFFLSENSRFVETGTGEFSFCGKPELENFFFFYPRILVLCKTGTGEFSF